MSTLFPLEPIFPEGFQYCPAFISAEEEAILIKEIEAIELHTFIFQGYAAKRKVASFGYDWSFEKRQLKKGKEIPEAFRFLIQRVAKRLSIEPHRFAELLITEYPPGSVINWHRDAPPFDLIAGISLLSDSTFRLRPHDQEKQGRSSTLSIPVARRSLYSMEGGARTGWQHSIAAVKSLRYSITLRTLKEY